MLLYLVRHAIAEELEDVNGDDFQRKLTSKGRKQFTSLAEWLAEREHQPQLILSSPLVRAVQTAKIFASAAGLAEDQLRIETAVGPGHDPQQLLDLVRESRAESVAIVGHEPDMSHTTSTYIGGGKIVFHKGTIACVRFDEPPQLGYGELEWLVHPKLIRA